MLPQESIRNEINIPVKMRDGTVLYADIYRPDTKNKCPAIVTRFAYDKSILIAENPGYMNPQRFARAGYVVVVQDVRGRGGAEGESFLWSHEAEDGYDTIEWTAIQPWCDGNVGMYGLSYSGYTQWLTAATQPPHLKVICPVQSSPSARDYMTFNSGSVFGLQGHVSWHLGMCMQSFIRSKLPPTQAKALLESLYYAIDNIRDECSFLPLKDILVDRLAGQLGFKPSVADFITNMEDDDYWVQLNSIAPFEKITVPVFQSCGWYDQYNLAAAVSDSFNGMREGGGSDLARKNQKLLLGPWIHGSALLSNVGALDLGIASAGASIDLTGMHIRWFDYWLKGIANGIMDEPPIRIFVMGDNVWRNEKEWPLARTKYTKYYFHSDGKANSRFGNGVLSPKISANEETDVYLYDPRNPVPYKWGGSGISPTFVVQDQEEVEKRADVLVYTSEPLKNDLEVTGPIEAKLWASSSAVDTDFTTKLVDVYPNGKAYNLVEGIVRARHRQSVAKPKLIEPGKIYEYSIKLKPTSNVFKTGHRIRVQISSSNFPKWDRNLNTGHPIGQDAEIMVAMQTIYHDKQYPSHIVLPVIPR